MTNREPLRILLVEDNRGDVVMFQEALEAAAVPYGLDVVSDGASAAEALRRCAAGSAAAPDLVVLDLNLPGLSGREVLGVMAGLPELSAVPVAVLTTAASERGIAGEFPGLEVDFAVKTPHFRDLVEIVRRMVGRVTGPKGDSADAGR